MGSGRMGIGTIADGGGFSAPGMGWGATGGNTAAIVSTGGNIYFGSGDQANANSLKTRLLINSGESVFNDDSTNTDFRVESDSNTHALFVDAGNTRIGIANSGPEYPLDVTGVIQSGDQISVSGSRNLSLNYSNGTISGIGGYYGSGGMVLGYGVWPKSGSGSFVSSSAVGLSRQAIHLNGYDFDMYSGTNQTVAADADVTLALHAKLSGIGGYIFNEASADIDFRVETTANTHALFIDGSATGAGRVTVGGAVQAAVLTVQGGTTTEESLWIYGAASGKGGRIVSIRDTRANSSSGTEGTAGIRLTSSPGTDYVMQKHYDGSASNWMLTDQSGNEYITVEAAAAIVVNQGGSSSKDFRCESDGNVNMLFVDAGENRTGIGATGTGQTGSSFYVEGRTTLYNGSTTGGSVLLTDAYTPATNDHLLNIGTQRSSGGPFMSYGLGQNGSSADFVSTYDNFSGSHSVMVLNGASFEFKCDASNSQTTLGSAVTLLDVFKMGRSGVIANDLGNGTLDFRVEGGSNTHALFVDATAADVFFGASSSSYPTGNNFVHINETNGVSMTIGGHSGTHTVIQFKHNGSSTVGSIVVNSNSTTYNTSSDYRLKENITNADDAGSKIDAIQVRQYDWKLDGSHQDYGMVAQELQTVAPEAVSGDADSEEMMGVDYSKLVPMLIKEIQALRARVADLES
jgi:hypothetical protein